MNKSAAQHTSTLMTRGDRVLAHKYTHTAYNSSLAFLTLTAYITLSHSDILSLSLSSLAYSTKNSPLRLRRLSMWLSTTGLVGP